MSEYERKHWVEAMGGTWPAVNTLQRIRADSIEENLNSMAFTFLKDCLTELEDRGLNDQGLYRVGGVVSKVKKLLNAGLDPQPGDSPLLLNDPKLWESKTIASAVKQYFRDLSKPLMTHHLYTHFVEAIKHESETDRLHELQLVVLKLPIASREILKVLIRHLNKVAAKSDTNLMTASNLGVCFGPTLLRPKEETVASIMDIKFCNEVIEILIQNCDRFFPPVGTSPDVVLQNHYRKRSSEESPGSSTRSSHHQHHYQQRKSTPKRELRGSSTPKRTQSFSSFSQLSTNSLPDIKEFKDRALAALSAAARHQGGGDKSSKSMSSHHSTAVLASPSTVKHAIWSKLPSPTKVLSRSPSTQDDLMASLEMMNSLAADLPTSSPLKRSHTVAARRGGAHRQQQQQQQQQDPQTPTATIKKPPLPKSSAPSSAATTPTSFPTTPPTFSLHHQEGSNSRQHCNNHPVPNAVPSHQISSAVQSNYDNHRHHHHHHHHRNPHEQPQFSSQYQQKECGGDASSTCSSSNGSTNGSHHNGINDNYTTLLMGKGYRPPPPVPSYEHHHINHLSRNNSVPSIPTSPPSNNDGSLIQFQRAPKFSYDEGTTHGGDKKIINEVVQGGLPGKCGGYIDAYLASSPHLQSRPTELFVRQISTSSTTVKGMDSNGKQDIKGRVRLESSDSSSPTNMRAGNLQKDHAPTPPPVSLRKDKEECETPPPIPTRRYRRIYPNQPSSSLHQQTTGRSASVTPGSHPRLMVDPDMELQKDIHHDSNSPSSLESRRRLPHHGYASSSSNTTDSSPGLIRANMSMDSGVVIASPSPPTADSGIAISPPILARKAVRNMSSNEQSKDICHETRDVNKGFSDNKKSIVTMMTQNKYDKNGVHRNAKHIKTEDVEKVNVGGGDDAISVGSSSALSGVGGDSDTSGGSRYDNVVSERKRLSSDSLSKTSTLVAAAAAIAVANHTPSGENSIIQKPFEKGKF